MHDQRYDGFECHALDETHRFHSSRLPDHLRLDQAQFERLWALHPTEYHRIKIHGRIVETPRWQQAYGTDYHYTGHVNKALPMPDLVAALLDWAKRAIDARLNGALVNWYDGQLGH